MVKDKVSFDASKGDSYANFYADFCFLYSDFVGLPDRELKYIFSQSFKNKELKSQCLVINHQSPNLTFPELAAQIGVLCSNESPSHHLAKFRALRREDGESISEYSIRCRRVFDASIPPHEFPHFVNSEYYNLQLIDSFYAGLRSDHLRAEVSRQNPRTIDGAILLINEYLRSKSYNVISKSIGAALGKSGDIPLDRDIAMSDGLNRLRRDQGKNGKVNAVEIGEPEVGEPIDDDQWVDTNPDENGDEHVNATINQSKFAFGPRQPYQGGAASRGAPSRGAASRGGFSSAPSRPAYGPNGQKNCWNCGLPNHFAADCPKSQSQQQQQTPKPPNAYSQQVRAAPQKREANVVLKHSTAQVRRMDKAKRERMRKQLQNQVNMLVDEFEYLNQGDEEDAVVYQESDDDNDVNAVSHEEETVDSVDEECDEIINALQQGAKTRTGGKRPNEAKRRGNVMRIGDKDAMPHLHFENLGKVGLDTGASQSIIPEELVPLGLTKISSFQVLCDAAGRDVESQSYVDVPLRAKNGRICFDPTSSLTVKFLVTVENYGLLVGRADMEYLSIGFNATTGPYVFTPVQDETEGGDEQEDLSDGVETAENDKPEEITVPSDEDGTVVGNAKQLDSTLDQEDKIGVTEVKWVCALGENEFRLLNSSLPFARVRVYGDSSAKGGKHWKASCLMDSGASVSLVNLDALRNSNIEYSEFPTKITVKSFTGNTIQIVSKVRLFLDFGDFVKRPLELFAFRGSASYDMLIGYSDMGALTISLCPEERRFKIRNLTIDQFENCGNVDEVVNALMPDEGVNVSCFKTEVVTGVTMTGGDMMQIPLILISEEGGIMPEIGTYLHLCLDKKLMDDGITVPNPSLQVIPITQKRGAVGVLAYLHRSEDAKQPVNIQTGSSLGFLKPYVSAFDATMREDENVAHALTVQYVNTLEEAQEAAREQTENFDRMARLFKLQSYDEVKRIMKKPEPGDTDKIILYLKRRVLTPKEEADIKEARKEREARYDRPTLAKHFESTLARLPQKHQDVLLDVLMQEAGAFCESNVDVRHGCVLYEMDAVIPSHFQRHVAPYQTSAFQKLINARCQMALWRAGVIEPASAPGAASSPMVTVKRGGACPTDPESLAKLTDEEVLRLWRVCFDNSSLTESFERTPGDMPPMLACFSKLGKDSARSHADLKQGYYQIKQSGSGSKSTGSAGKAKGGANGGLAGLFSFFSDCKGIPFWHLNRVSQGAKESARGMCSVTEKLVNQLDQIPFQLTWKETEEAIKRLHADEPLGMEVNDNPSYGTGSFVDDVFCSTPNDMVEYRKLNIPDNTLLKHPESDEDRRFYFHLGVFRRVLFSLKEANLLINIKKCSIWSQDTPEVFLGFEIMKSSIRVPRKTREVLVNIASPTSVRDVRKIVGLTSFFRNLVPYLGIYSAFLFEKLKNDVRWSWTPEDEEKYRELLERVATACNEGLLYILDLNVRKTLHGISDWCRDTNSSAFILCARFEENGKVRCVPGLVDSRKLPSSIADKASCIAEISSIVSSLSVARGIIGNLPINIYTDSIATVHLVKRSYASQAAIDNRMVRRLLMLLAEFSVIVKFVPGKSLEYSADTLSRIKTERGMSTDELLDKTDKLSEYIWVDEQLRPEVKNETAKEFEKRSRNNLEAMMRIEIAKGLGCDETERLFADTHLFSKPLQDASVSALHLALEEHDLEEIYRHPNNLPDVREDVFEAATPPVILDEADRVPADKMETKEVGDNEDFLTMTIPSNHFSGMTEYGLNKERQDIAVISRYKELAETVLDPYDGMYDPTVVNNGPDLNDHLHTINAIRIYCEENNLDLRTEPLFTSMEEVKENLNRAHLSNEIRAKKRYFKAAQKREMNLRLIYDVVTGKIPATHNNCEILKRTDALFHTLFHDLESVVVHEGLLFRIKFPAKGQSMRCCVILNSEDAYRMVRRFHNLSHRGAYWSYCNLSRQIYALSLLGICKNTVKSCSFCASNYLHKVAIRSKLTNVEIDSGQVWVDLCGPIKRRQGASTGSDAMAYVMVCLQGNTWHHTFLFLENKTASLVWRVFLEGFLRYFNVSRVVCDNGGEFRKMREELALLNVAVRCTNAYHPAGNTCEQAVKRFSKAFRFVLNGDATTWKQRLAYVQIVVNQSLIHPVTKVSPAFALGNGDNATFAGPAVVFADERAKDEQLGSRHPMTIMKAIADKLRTHYQAYLSPVSDHRTTFGSLGIVPGTKVFFRAHGSVAKSPGMAKLFPKFLSGEVVRLNGRTSSIIRSYRTGKLVSRHISDVFRHYSAVAGPEEGFMDSLRREQKDKEVDFNDKEAEEEAQKQMRADATAHPLVEQMMNEAESTSSQKNDEAKEPDGGKTSQEADDDDANRNRRSRRLRGLAPESAGQK